MAPSVGPLPSIFTGMPVALVKLSVQALPNALIASPPQFTTTSGLSAAKLTPLRMASGSAASRPMPLRKERRSICPRRAFSMMTSMQSC
ncbi:hypothetical protein D3C81_1807320 [compost metagenome]